MTSVKQRCKVLLKTTDNRVVIISDAEGYKNLTDIIRRLCQQMMEIEIGEFSMTDYDDYVVSCTQTSFINFSCALFRMYDEPKFFKNIPRIFFDMFYNGSCNSICETIRKRQDLMNFNEMRKSADNNNYEFVNPNDYCNLSEESRMDHLFVNLELITDSMIAQRFENRHGFNGDKHSDYTSKTCIYISSIDSTFIRPAEIKMGTPMYRDWCNVCEKANDLYKSMIKDAVSSNVARSVLPMSAAKTVHCGATLRSWQSFLKYVRFSSFAYMSENASEIVLMICNVFDSSLITEEMRDNIESIKKDIAEHVTFPF